MADGLSMTISEWRPVTELKLVKEDISAFGYSKEYITEHKLEDKKSSHGSSGITGHVNYFEPLEVKEDGGNILYRENDNYVHMDVPEMFKTQCGTFNNHNNGEFPSWLGNDDYDVLSQKDKETHQLFGRGGFYIDGNFCDMFDCGEYSYAVSNLMHMGFGRFKIVRIDQNLQYEVLYDNSSLEGWNCLEYEGRFKNSRGVVIVASGFNELRRGHGNERNFQDRTLLLQINNDGSCNVSREWNISISSPNSMAVMGDYIYFGQNKMVTRLNLTSGELSYFTNKSDEELAALKKMW